MTKNGTRRAMMMVFGFDEDALLAAELDTSEVALLEVEVCVDNWREDVAPNALSTLGSLTATTLAIVAFISLERFMLVLMEVISEYVVASAVVSACLAADIVDAGDEKET
jgi:hypothetical protein